MPSIGETRLRRLQSVAWDSVLDSVLAWVLYSARDSVWKASRDSVLCSVWVPVQDSSVRNSVQASVRNVIQEALDVANR